MTEKVMINQNSKCDLVRILLTVNSRKYRTLFINYDFRWLMVAEIYYQLKQKIDGKSIAYFVHKNTIFPHKSLLSTYLACHSSAIYPNKGICLPYMLFTYLLLVPHTNYALNYTCLQVRLGMKHRLTIYLRLSRPCDYQDFLESCGF